MLTKLEETISIPPCELGDIPGYIHRVLNARIGSCHPDHGYIQSYGDLLNHTSLYINQYGNAIYNIQYMVNMIKPEVGHTYECIIDIIFNEGIFVYSKDIKNLKILTPSRTLENWTFCNQIYISPTKHIFKKGDTVQVEITALQYENNGFLCIGKLNDTK
jgi:DNA-directed RNA polymerase subunit E'/Rpb7